MLFRSRGYYDRALTALDAARGGGMPGPPAVFAVLFDADLVAAVPREPHDRAVDGVVTPTRTVDLRRRAVSQAAPVPANEYGE